jgi:peptide-methionine (S)-S-oxide reductase
VTDAASIRAYDDAASGETATATFALGCFWGPDATFGAIDGVVRTRVGYAGGTTPDPTYRDLGDHSEAVQIEYDPDRLSYRDLLAVAFESHDYRRQPNKRQYQGVVFHETPSEREAVEEHVGTLDGPVETRIEPLDAFHLAETYHQKYSLRSKRWLESAFAEAGYDDAAIRESPAAAKLNAEAAGRSVPERASDLLG